MAPRNDGGVVTSNGGVDPQSVFTGEDTDGGHSMSLCGPCGRYCLGREICSAGVCIPPYDSVPRLLWPVSLGRLTSRRPTFRWLNPSGVDGGRLELCHDRACTMVVHREDVTGTSFRPTTPLAPGVYFWHVLPRRGEMISQKGSHTWEFVIHAVDTEVDTAFARINDFDGDGFADTVFRSSDGLRMGAYYGSPSGLTLAPRETWSLQSVVGVRVFTQVDDIDGDGFADVLVTDGESTTAVPERAVLLRGGESGLSRFEVPLGVEGPWPRVLLAAGDLDGDGFGDLVGLDRPDDGVPGRVVFFYGTAEGVRRVPSAVSFGDIDLGAVTLATRGDYDGDQRPDLVVGDSQRARRTGGVFVWLNRATCGEGAWVALPLTPSMPSMPPEGMALGESLSANGDFDGDGYIDPVASAPTSLLTQDESAVWLYDGGAGVTSLPTRRVFPGRQRMGFMLGTGGDLDGDGYGDLVVWMHNLQIGPLMKVYRGGNTSGLSQVATTLTSADFGSTETALSFRWVGDTDRDGRDDLLILLTAERVVLARGTEGGVPTGALPALELP